VSSVLDASAVLALLNGEPGAEIVASEPEPVISSVNLSEVVAKLAERGGTEPGIRVRLGDLRLDVRDFDSEAAYAAGLLRPLTRAQGLSLGDRACLALAMRLGVPLLTADRVWRDLPFAVDVRVIR
jgi:ribonuclease VapC